VKEQLKLVLHVLQAMKTYLTVLLFHQKSNQLKLSKFQQEVLKLLFVIISVIPAHLQKIIVKNVDPIETPLQNVIVSQATIQ